MTTTLPSPHPTPRKLVAAFAVIYFGWGSTFLAIRYAVDAIPPFVMAGTRNLAAGLVLVTLGLASGAPWPSAGRCAQAMLFGGLMFVVNHGGISWAEQRIPSGVTALIAATIPLWIVVLEWLVGDHRRPTPRVAGGIALGFLGSLALVWPGRSTSAIDGLGALVAAGAALSWAVGTMLGRRIRVSDSVLLATGLPMIFGGSMLYGVALLRGEWSGFDPVAVPARSIAALAYLILMGSLLGFSAYVWLLRVAPPTRVATYAYVNPIVALAIGAALGGEPLSAATIVAGTMSLVGVFLVVSD